MKSIITTGLAVILLAAISCKKENTAIQSLSVQDESAITDSYEPATYTSVKIGTQKWMSANLAVTRYRNGDKIPQVKDPSKWTALTTGAWCWYNNDSVTGATYGKLYNWYAVNDPRGLAPEGWHIPADAEWDTLSAYVGYKGGGKLKDTGTIEAGTGLWYAPNKGANNRTGFTGLPGGDRDSYDGMFKNVGYAGYWWSSTQGDAGNAWSRDLFYNGGKVGGFDGDKHSGFSVRCIKD